MDIEVNNTKTFAVVFLNGMLKKIDAYNFVVDDNSNVLFYDNTAPYPQLTNSIASGIWAFVEEYNPETHKELVEDIPEQTNPAKNTILEMIKNKDN